VTSYSFNGISGVDRGLNEYNFTNFEWFTLIVYKYTDLTGDGYTSDDILLPGWSFDLELDNSYFITFNDTDDGASDGAASIILKQGGSYKVTEVLQSGYTQTGITEYPFTGISGVDRGIDEYNFTNFEWFTLTVYKYTDLTGDGYSSDDTLLPGWSFDLELDGSHFITFNDTDDGSIDGVASIVLMQGGSYKVTEVLQFGYTQTGITEYPFTGISGMDRGLNEYNFTNFKWFTLTVYKYTDITGDGYSSGDTLLSGWSFDLELDGSHFITFNDTDDGSSDGVASIVLKQGGSYKVTEVLQSGYTQTGITSYSFNGISGVDRGVDEYNFTNFKWFTLTVYKYTDLTGDGYSSDDTLLPGWSFDLELDGSYFITFNDTDDGFSDGVASIVLKQGGSYVVTEVLQSGYTQTGINSYSFTGISGVDRGLNEYNFTNFEWFTLTAYKYTDLTGDGYTSDDILLPGWSFDLELDGSYFITFNDTDDGSSDGVASIVLKQGGSYKVTEVLQSGYTQTGITEYPFTGISGMDRGLNEYNFTNFKWFTLTVYKYTDLTGDGYTSDDILLPGWSFDLELDGSHFITFNDTDDGISDGVASIVLKQGGSYKVTEVLQSGYTQTGITEYPFIGISGVDRGVDEYNFTNFKWFTLTVYKYTDLTGDGYTSDDTLLRLLKYCNPDTLRLVLHPIHSMVSVVWIVELMNTTLPTSSGSR
jgi:hypothetical protein